MSQIYSSEEKKGGYYCPHFTNEETMPEMQSNLDKMLIQIWEHTQGVPYDSAVIHYILNK